MEINYLLSWVWALFVNFCFIDIDCKTHKAYNAHWHSKCCKDACNDLLTLKVVGSSAISKIWLIEYNLLCQLGSNKQEDDMRDDATHKCNKLDLKPDFEFVKLFVHLLIVCSVYRSFFKLQKQEVADGNDIHNLQPHCNDCCNRHCRQPGWRCKLR